MPDRRRRYVLHRLARSRSGSESSRERHEADDKNAYAYSFITLERAEPLPAIGREAPA